MVNSETDKRRRNDNDTRSANKRAKKTAYLAGSSQQRRQKNVEIKGPGIFVSCVRGRERKAADELIAFLEEICERLYGRSVQDGNDKDKVTTSPPPYLDHVGFNGETEIDDDALRNGVPITAAAAAAAAATAATTTLQEVNTKANDDIEAGIQAELDAMNHSSSARSSSRQQRPRQEFRAVMTDTECLVFISVPAHADPVELSVALLERIRETGQAPSRFVQRLSPVQDIIRAELDDIEKRMDRLLAETFPDMAAMNENDSDSSNKKDAESQSQERKTYKVDVKMRFHTRFTKMDIVQTIAARMPSSSFKANLTQPDYVVNVEVLRMHVGLAILRDYDTLRRYNPLMLAEQVQRTEADAAAASNNTNNNPLPLSRVSVRAPPLPLSAPTSTQTIAAAASP